MLEYLGEPGVGVLILLENLFPPIPAWFIAHETKTVFYGRMIPIFRSLISIPAGVERMNMGKFIAYTTAGSLIWNNPCQNNTDSWLRGSTFR